MNRFFHNRKINICLDRFYINRLIEKMNSQIGRSREELARQLDHHKTRFFNTYIGRLINEFLFRRVYEIIRLKYTSMKDADAYKGYRYNLLYSYTFTYNVV